MIKKVKKTFWKWIFAMLFEHGPWTHSHFVANRYERWVEFGKREFKFNVKCTDQPDAYTREELLNLLKLVRIHEETQQWSVPEPDRCIYCNHCSGVDENGFCPAPAPKTAGAPVRTGFKDDLCGCPTHQGGLSEAFRRKYDFSKRYQVSPEQQRQLRYGDWKHNPLDAIAQVCTREPGHPNPCNGFPRADCKRKMSSELCGND